MVNRSRIDVADKLRTEVTGCKKGGSAGLGVAGPAGRTDWPAGGTTPRNLFAHPQPHRTHRHSRINVTWCKKGGGAGTGGRPDRPDGGPTPTNLFGKPSHSGLIALTQLRTHARNANANASVTGIDFLVLGRSSDGLTAPDRRSHNAQLIILGVVWNWLHYLLLIWTSLFLSSYIYIYIYICAGIYIIIYIVIVIVISDMFI